MPYDPEYHRRWLEKNREHVRAKQRERYATDAEYRKGLRDSRRKYLATGNGVKKRAESKRAFYEKNPTYNAEYAKAHSAKASARTKAWRDENPERAREHDRRNATSRRARKAGLFVEDVDRLIVLERDDGICGICGEDVDPMNFHVDHITPLPKGGSHAYYNVQVAHPLCNCRKGAS